MVKSSAGEGANISPLSACFYVFLRVPSDFLTLHIGIFARIRNMLFLVAASLCDLIKA